MTLECLSVMDGAIYDWSVKEFIEMLAHCAIITQKWKDGAIDFSADVCVWTAYKVQVVTRSCNGFGRKAPFSVFMTKFTKSCMPHNMQCNCAIR